MAIPIWMAVVAGVGALLGGGGIASVIVARTQAKASLPAHLNAELVRQGKELRAGRSRLDAVEAHLVVLGDHIDLLEAHIWKQLPPPPPPRPIYRPHIRNDDE